MSNTQALLNRDWPSLNNGAIDTLVALIERGPLTPQEIPSKVGMIQLQSLMYCVIIVEYQVAHRYAATSLGSIAYMRHFGNSQYLNEAIAHRQSEALISKIIRKK